MPYVLRHAQALQHSQSSAELGVPECSLFDALDEIRTILRQQVLERAGCEEAERRIRRRTLDDFDDQRPGSLGELQRRTQVRQFE